jgi:protein O-GlcNAc transferase
MKKVLSFSLWGNQLKYTIGSIKNADLASEIYPEFECWFYIHEETVPQEIITQLSQRKNVKIIIKCGNLNTCKPMMWRFEAIDDHDVEIMMPRDTDTRIYLREREAYDEWILSKKSFHIMRDHPEHTSKILGGMFGTKKIPNIPSWKDVMNPFQQTGYRQYDQDFLVNYIYPKIKDDCLIHASFYKIENDMCKPFPSKYDDEFHFVGEYVYENDTRNENDVFNLMSSNIS